MKAATPLETGTAVTHNQPEPGRPARISQLRAGRLPAATGKTSPSDVHTAPRGSSRGRKFAISDKDLEARSLQAEALSAASPARDLCRACDLFATCRNPFAGVTVPEDWERGKKLVLVGDAPDKHEDRCGGELFTGPAGQLMRRLLRKAGYESHDVAFVNALRCCPPHKAAPRMQQLRACRPFLLRALQVLRPRKVLGLGPTATQALTNNGRMRNITKLRGRLLSIPGLRIEPDSDCKSYATYSPGTAVSEANDSRLERELLARGARLVRTEDLARPLRNTRLWYLPDSVIKNLHRNDRGERSDAYQTLHAMSRQSFSEERIRNHHVSHPSR